MQILIGIKGGDKLEVKVLPNGAFYTDFNSARLIYLPQFIGNVHLNCLCWSQPKDGNEDSYLLAWQYYHHYYFQQYTNEDESSGKACIV